MKCPHCFLELILRSQDHKEVDQCPKCEGIWLGIDNSENIFDFTDDHDKKMQEVKDLQDTVDENQDNKRESDYYYYKKPFKENEKLDDMFDFE
jgi:Zn-finger nucleic acid-binding protein